MRIFKGTIYTPTPCSSYIISHGKMLKKTIHPIKTSYSSCYKLKPSDLIKIKDTNLKCLLFSNPNPITGVYYSKQEIQKLSVILNENNWIVLSDETNKHLCYHPTYYSINHTCSDNSIVLSSISKDIGCKGFRAGWIGFPEKLNMYYRKLLYAKHSLTSCIGSPVTYLLDHYFTNMEDLYNKYHEKVAKLNKNILFNCIRFLKTTDISYILPDSGFCLLLDFDNYRVHLNNRGIYTNQELLLELFKETGILCKSGNQFCCERLSLRFVISSLEQNQDTMDFRRNIEILKEIHNFIVY